MTPFEFRQYNVMPRTLAVLGALLLFGAAAQPALAEEEDDPSFITIGAGYFDILHDSDEAVELRLEYRDKHRIWLFKPFGGITATSDAAVYPYAGVLTDFYFGNRIVVSPSVAVGAYFEGNGKDLGHVFEIRSPWKSPTASMIARASASCSTTSPTRASATTKTPAPKH